MQQLLPRAATGHKFMLPTGGATLVHNAPWTSGQSSSSEWTARYFEPAPVGGMGRLGRIARRQAGGLSGLGAGETANLALQAGSIGASAAVGIGTALAAGASLAVPIVGPAIAGIALAINAILHSGCGQTCVITSNWANEAEALLKQNKAAYFGLPAPRNRAQQTAALGNFDAVWNYLRQECGNPQVGDAGKRCIEDRQAGACKWKDAQGQCFNWFSGYRDPIAADPVVDTQESNAAMGQMGSDPVGQLAQDMQAGGGGGGMGLLLAGGLLMLLAMGGGS